MVACYVSIQVSGKRYRYLTVDAPSFEEALEQAGIKEDDSYEIVEGDISKDRCLKSTITDDSLFGS